MLEWTGETTLATADRGILPGSERASAELLRAIAAVLAEAHRLGLAHGRLGPDHVFLTAAGQVKLDFSGAAAGFPPEPKRCTARDASETSAEAVSLAVLRSGDLFGLGALVARLDRKGDDKAREESQLGKLARSSWQKTRPTPAGPGGAGQARQDIAAPGRHRRLERAG